MYHHSAQTGQQPIPGPSQHEAQPHPMPQPPFLHQPQLFPPPPLPPPRFGSLPPGLYSQPPQYAAPGAYSVPHGGYIPAPHAMGAAQPYHPSASSSAQPPYDQHFQQQLGQQAPVDIAEESAVKLGKRKMVDSNDDDMPRNKRTKSRKDHPDFEMVEVNRIIRYKCRLPQCVKVELMQSTSIAKHIGSMKHSEGKGQRVPCPYCGKFASRSDSLSRHIRDTCPKNPKKVSQAPCDDLASEEPLFFVSFEETHDLTSGESSKDSITSLTGTNDSAPGESLEYFTLPELLDETGDLASGQSSEDDINIFDETEDLASGQSLEDFIDPLDETDNSAPGDDPDRSTPAPEESSERFIANLDKPECSAPAESFTYFINSEPDHSAPADSFQDLISTLGETDDSAPVKALQNFIDSLDDTDDSALGVVG